MYNGSGPAEAAEELQYYVLNASLADMSRQILENPISYQYQRNTGELKIPLILNHLIILFNVFELIIKILIRN